MAQDKKEKSDFEFFKKVMPNYFVTIDSSILGGRPDKIRCRSNFGIVDEDEQWTYLMKAFKQRWGDRFIEVDHNVSADHSDFTIYLKSD